MIRSRLFVLTTLALLAASVSAQEADTTQQITPGRLVVQTNLGDGMLYANGSALGTAEAGVFEFAPGRYTLTLAEPDREAWDARQASAEVDVRAGETTTVCLDVPYRYRIESFPYGATVTLGEGEEARVLGETPLTLDRPTPLDGDLVVALPGHLSARQPAGTAADNHYSFVLRPLDAEREGAAEVGWSERKRPNPWIDVAAVGLALTAGVVSAYYKFEGDDIYDEYVETGDPALRPEFERYDTYSAIALGAMQVGIGVFAVRLVLR